MTKNSMLPIEIIKTETACHEISPDCQLTYLHIKVNDLKSRAKDIMSQILDVSWILQLDNELDKASFLARSTSTINLLCNILKEVGNEIGVEFGEYLVSHVAKTTVEDNHSHESFPLAELWKEKSKGNPGFDFHTISPNSILFFGEAKFNSNSNAYSAAISQICQFITKGKDDKELTDLQKLNTRLDASHLLPTSRGYIAAFSIHNNFKNIFNTIQRRPDVKKHLSRHPELFFIGIEI